MTLAGQDASTSHAQAGALAHHGHPRRDHLGLVRGCELLRLRQITQGKLIAQAPEHHEGDDIAGVLCAVQRASTPLVELLAASAAAEPAVTLSGALAPFRNGHRAAALYPHQARSNRDCGASADGALYGRYTKSLATIYGSYII
jgi:hypothetical protein